MANATKEMVNAAKDIGLISKELEGVDATKAFYKLQEQGEVISEEILPAFAKRLKEVASVGLDKKLESNAVAMQRFVNVSLPMAGNEFFKAGWGEGLTDLFNTLAENMVDLIPLFKSLGRIAGSIAKTIARAIDLITPPLRVLGNILNWVTGITGDFSLLISTAFVGASMAFLSSSKRFALGSTIIRSSLIANILKPLLAIIVILAEVEEMLNKLVFKDKIGVDYDPRLDKRSKHFDKKMWEEKVGSDLSKEERMLFNSNSPSPLTDPVSWGRDAISFFKSLYEPIGGIQPNAMMNNIPPVNIVNNIVVDGEVVATSVTNTSAFENGVAKTIYPIMQGGQ